MAQAKEQKNSTMSDREFYFLMGVVTLILLILYLTKHEERILFSIYQHFDKIGMGLYGLFALGIFLLKEKMKNVVFTKKISSRRSTVIPSRAIRICSS